MKVSELINGLQDALLTYGDLDVIVDFDSEYSTGDIEEISMRNIWHSEKDSNEQIKERIIIKC